MNTLLAILLLATAYQIGRLIGFADAERTIRNIRKEN